jgi:O-antigen ligase
MLELAVILAAEVALLAAVVVLKEPRLLIPAVALGLPVEYLETRAVGHLGESGVAGAVRSLMNPGQAAMVGVVVIGAIRLRHTPSRLIPDSSVVIPVLALFAVMVLGIAWSDAPTTPPNSVLILVLYLAFIFVAPSLIQDRRDVERIVGVLLLMAILLGLLAVSQRLLGVFNWRTILVQSDDYSYRSNATFADPNNLARYLAIVLSLAAGLVLATGPRRQTLYLAVPALAIGAMAIVATASRSGWMVLLLCGFITVILAPIPRYTKLRLTAASVIGLGALLGLLLWQGGTDAERVKSLTQGLQVIGQREFLIRAGWEMWKDSPLIGLGTGNYQHALQVSYLHLIPYWARTTLSHTSLVSLMAELGLVGLAVFTFFAVRVAINLASLYRRASTSYHRLMIGLIGAGLIAILLQSQSEGRLLDEPYSGARSRSSSPSRPPGSPAPRPPHPAMKRPRPSHLRRTARDFKQDQPATLAPLSCLGAASSSTRIIRAAIDMERSAANLRSSASTPLGPTLFTTPPPP